VTRFSAVKIGARRRGRRRGKRLIGLAFAALLVLPGAAWAGLEVKGVDTTGYPEIRVTVVTSAPTAVPPKLSEGGAGVSGLSAENLGRAKSAVLAIDRSRSMQGQALVDAIAAARAFIGAKPADDRIALTVFGSNALTLTDFSTATIDADTALRTLSVDDRQGTALYDAIVAAASALTSEPLQARVIIVLTDGRDVSSSASLEQAIVAARDAGAAVYPIGIEGKQFSPDALKQIAAETGGTYYGAASTEALGQVYSSIAEELKRTWQVSYVTAARPGETLALHVESGGTAAHAEAKAPGVLEAAPKQEPSKVIPRSLLDSAYGPLAVGGIVGLILLIAGGLAFASPKGAWVRSRIQPHLGEKRRERRRARDAERVSLVRSVFVATERAFGEKRIWQKLQLRLERADFPLRTAEFVYLMTGCGFFFGIVAAVAGASSPLILAGLVGGALLPHLFVGIKGRRRVRAFENQLPDILVTMAASLKAGHSFRQGMQSVVEEGMEPASKEFKRVLTETQLGRSMDDALADMSTRVGSKNLEFVINAVTIQRQVGGSLAGLFDMVADTVRGRQQFQRKVKGLTSMGRASAYVLVGLPFFVAGAIPLINAEYMSPLFHTSTGQKLMLTGAGMMCVGGMFLKKIVSFKG
jgi:tight adherence protein B